MLDEVFLILVEWLLDDFNIFGLVLLLVVGVGRVLVAWILMGVVEMVDSDGICCWWLVLVGLNEDEVVENLLEDFKEGEIFNLF